MSEASATLQGENENSEVNLSQDASDEGAGAPVEAGASCEGLSVSPAFDPAETPDPAKRGPGRPRKSERLTLNDRLGDRALAYAENSDGFNRANLTAFIKSLVRTPDPDFSCIKAFSPRAIAYLTHQPEWAEVLEAMAALALVDPRRFELTRAQKWAIERFDRLQAERRKSADPINPLLSAKKARPIEVTASEEEPE